MSRGENAKECALSGQIERFPIAVPFEESLTRILPTTDGIIGLTGSIGAVVGVESGVAVDIVEFTASGKRSKIFPLLAASPPLEFNNRNDLLVDIDSEVITGFMTGVRVEVESEDVDEVESDKTRRKGTFRIDFVKRCINSLVAADVEEEVVDPIKVSSEVTEGERM